MLEVHEYTGAEGHGLRYGKLINPANPDTGRALLYVPGLGGSIKSALAFLNALLPEFSPIYGPDLRGFGLNPLEAPLPKADIILQDLEAFHQQVLAPAGHQSLALCGLSLGGVLATLLAAQTPERYQKLVLLAPAYRPNAQSFSLAYTLRNTLAFLLLGSRARTTLPYTVAAITRNESVLNDPQAFPSLQLSLTPGFLLSVRSLCNRAMSQAAQLTVPTLMVIPGQDIVCDPVAMRQTFAKIPAKPKTCREMPDFYHDVVLEPDSPQLAREIAAWLLAPNGNLTTDLDLAYSGNQTV